MGTCGRLICRLNRPHTAAPVKVGDVLNVVVGVNHHLYDPARFPIVTAASCTTNCLAPVVKVVHDAIGIRHGQITTIHDPTNTSLMVDAPHKDLRRARSAMLSLAPPRLPPRSNADRPGIVPANGKRRGRVALLRGSMNIESSQGNGTILQVEIPSPHPLIST